MLTKVLYGKSEIDVEVPDDSTVIEPLNIDPVENVEGTIKDVLQHPTNSKPLKDRVKSSDTVSSVISDITRPTPN
ncbi:lactate racemase domain-containing protein, partial [Staphylococcus warneri]|uniref:lactate racemase domain-containing protein n=1 Tax=Staphylococcus warneri TaxID=1292 RepID=UPI0030C1B984